MGNPVRPTADKITLMAIYEHIRNDIPLLAELSGKLNLENTVAMALDFPKGFASYCTVSNTVKAIGIGGTASLFFSIKISDFLTSTKEAQSRNLVALTRSNCVAAYHRWGYALLPSLLPHHVRLWARSFPHWRSGPRFQRLGSLTRSA